MLDPAMAAQRDAGVMAMRASGQTPPPPLLPPLQNGCLMGGSESGALFFQPLIGGLRLDAVLGTGAWLITREPVAEVPDTVRMFTIGSDALGIFSDLLEAWLNERSADAVLVRPDRYVFGIGDTAVLLAAWDDRLCAPNAPAQTNGALHPV